MPNKKHDLIVIGAGSGGYAAARTAREKGADVALVDQGPLGGLCILRGCMPSKTFLASSDAAHDIREAGALGIKTGPLEIDFPFIANRKRELIAGFADYRIEGIQQFPLYYGRAKFLSRTQIQVGEHQVLDADRFIIATGSVVAPNAIPGLDDAGYIDSDDALDLKELPKSLIVLGGGYVGAELGQFFGRMGVKTTIVLRSPHLLSGTDHDIGEALTEYYREEGIEVHTDTLISRVSTRGGKKVVHAIRKGLEVEVEADEIMYCLGRVPDIEGLDLEKAGVRAHAVTGIEVGLDLRTSNPHIFAVGDVSGRFLLVHVAIYQGEIAARNAIDNAAEPADYRIVKAHTIFSDPQVAIVGDSERDLQSMGITYIKGRYDFAEHGKAMAINKTKGFVKMMATPDTGKILGAAILGVHGSDLIHEIIVAMSYNATVFEFMKIPHLHPTLAEIWTYPAEEIAGKLGAVVPDEEVASVARTAG
ncbi:MAG: dihydrolipoyl dehydrogenase [Candidatus Eremiobacteraeota bacterium]|nr:dihydrolipoyl dehydrogenase [Candidatus Eremiobacteraeota bacterium]